MRAGIARDPAVSFRARRRRRHLRRSGRRCDRALRRRREPWLVAVEWSRKASTFPAGVGVYANDDDNRAVLFGRPSDARALTRGVPRQRAWLYNPDESAAPESWPGRSPKQRRHSLRARRGACAAAECRRPAGDADQISLFAVISAVATGSGRRRRGALRRRRRRRRAGFELTLGEPPPLAGGPAHEVLTRREEKSRLRNANTAVAAKISRRTGMTHARVNCRAEPVCPESAVSARRRLPSCRYGCGPRIGWLAKT